MKENKQQDNQNIVVKIFKTIFIVIYLIGRFWYVFLIVFALIFVHMDYKQREHDKRVKEIQKQKEELENKKQGNTGKDSYQTKTPKPGFTSSPISKDSYWSVYHDDYEEDYDYWYDDYDVYDYDSPEEFYEYNKNYFYDFEDAENYYYDHGGQ